MTSSFTHHFKCCANILKSRQRFLLNYQFKSLLSGGFIHRATTRGRCTVISTLLRLYLAFEGAGEEETKGFPDFQYCKVYTDEIPELLNMNSEFYIQKCNSFIHSSMIKLKVLLFKQAGSLPVISVLGQTSSIEVTGCCLVIHHTEDPESGGKLSHVRV